MATTTERTTHPSEPFGLGIAARLLGVYLVLAGAAVLILAATAALTSDQETGKAWGHAMVVVAFAVLFAWHLRVTRGIDTLARRLLVALVGVLLVVGAVQAAMPGTEAGWLRAELGTLALAMAVFLAVVRPPRTT